jgi:AraC family transcriptional regulator, transcriptional activator of pobA
MPKTEKIEDFYKRKMDWVPENLRNGMGHFNVFRLEPYVGARATAVPYTKRDYYKVTLAIGNGKVHYADKVIEVKHRALTFSNPRIPYKWENTDRISGGFFCIFTAGFFHQFGSLEHYAVYQPGGTHVFELTDEQLATVTKVFERMLEEIGSDYIHKYDVLRNLVFELLHFAMRSEPTANFEHQPMNAAKRISSLFLELLERQFPIDDNHQRIQLRTASDFATQLAVHVNHLNSALKQIMDKTTTQVIAERLLQEAKVLLRHSNWSVSEIAFALGFNEVTHFSNFFGKHTGASPMTFRKNGIA